MEAKVNDWPQSELRYSLFTNSQYLPPAPEYSVLDYSQPFYDMPITPTNSLTSHAMPSLLWSSIRTTQAPFAELRIPPSTISTPISPPSTPSSRKVIAGRSRPRRMLSGEDRRKMCLYKEENPSMRQRDIAGLFGVDRSTVSKALRLKGKYLDPRYMKQPSIDPVKSRVPDIEKALSNWVKNNQRQGLSVSDKDIVEKAIFFARACRCPRDKESMFTATWLKMFKKNHLLFISSRKGSIEVPSRSSSPASVRTLSMSLTTDGSSSMSPPSSPTDAFGSLSSIQSQKCAVDELVDATRGLVNDITSLAEIPCPKSTPGIPFTQRIEPRLPDSAEASRSHSQTAPPLQYDPVLSACWTMDQNDSGADLLPSSPAAVLETSNVMGNLTKPSSTNPGTWTKDTLLPPLDSKFDIALTVNPSGSPTRDEARQALELVLSYFKHHQTGLAPQEYMTFGRIMERLDGTAQIRERDSFACN